MNEKEKIEKLEEAVKRLAGEKLELVAIVESLSHQLCTMIQNPVVFKENRIETDKTVS